MNVRAEMCSFNVLSACGVTGNVSACGAVTDAPHDPLGGDAYIRVRCTKSAWLLDSQVPHNIPTDKTSTFVQKCWLGCMFHTMRLCDACSRIKCRRSFVITTLESRAALCMCQRC